MKSRNRSLDVLRGVAILLVLGRHFPYYTTWARGGWIGVDLFFVISGFLISGLLFAEYKATGTIRFKRFFIRRGLKIYPPYYAFLLLMSPFTIHHLTLADLTFMQSYFKGFWGHDWSLSIEEHFYIVLPLVFTALLELLPDLEFDWIPYALPVVIAACLAMRAAVGRGAADRQVLNPTHLRFDALFMGVALGWLYHFRKEKFQTVARQTCLLPLGLLLSSSGLFIDHSAYLMYTLGFAGNLLGFACIVLWAVEHPALGKLSPVALIGVYSYSIYPWHWPLWQIGEDMLGVTFSGFWIYVIASITTGIIMAKAVEMPVLRLRERYFPANSGSLQLPLQSLRSQHRYTAFNAKPVED